MAWQRLAIGASLAALTSTRDWLLPLPSRLLLPECTSRMASMRLVSGKKTTRASANLPSRRLLSTTNKLTAYVKGVLCEAVGADRCNAARVYILREPSFNASMAANGAMRVHTGLLLRTRNEAELGAVLGHEFGHFEMRHGVQRFKSQRGVTDVTAWAQVLASMSSSYDVRRSYQNLELSVFGHFFRYVRDQEREADLVGIGYLNNSDLRPQSAAVVWQNFMGEVQLLPA